VSERRVLIIAGPNGAGKTTFARAFLPQEAHCPRFINADLIAAGLSPFEPEAAAVRAGRIMLAEIDACIAHDESFAFETTLAGRSYLGRIAAWRAAGWHVTLFFLALPEAEAAIARVANRVRQGGHDIPEGVIRRRFAAGRSNFERLYRDVVDDWMLYDNAGDEPLLLDWKEQR
jgi:predicted ABC-type ATPase